MHSIPFSSPRWLYAFFHWAYRLPGAVWLFVLLAVAGVYHWVAWATGYLGAGRIDVPMAAMSLYLVVGPLVWMTLARRAQQELSVFFEESGKSPAEIEAAILDFNSLPESSALLLALGGLAGGLIAYRYIAVPGLPFTEAVLPGLNLFIWVYTMVFFSLVFGRILRQAVLMRKFFAEVHVDIFRPVRIYALTRYGAYFSVLLILLFYGGNLLSYPAFLFTPASVYLQLFFLALIFLLFYIPIAGINQRMVQAKARLLNELGRDLETLFNQIHAAAGAGDITAVDKHKGALETLKDLREFIQQLPTWPWQPGTFKNLLAPLLVPVVVFLIQQIISRLIES